VTSYQTASAEGRAASREATTGRRKVLADRIEYGEEGGSPSYRTRPVYLIGSCGHRLRWRAGYPVGAIDPPDFVRRLGRKMTCDHADCRIPARPEVPDAERCEYVMGIDVERRCPTRSRFETEMGRVCRKHRDYYVREGYLDEEGRAR
jgi:hypothetical protein